jgi:hypothetical protein
MSLPDDDLVTRLLDSDGRVDELLKEAAEYITTLRQAIVVLNNQLNKESNHDEANLFNRSPPLTDAVERLWQSGDAA